MKTNQIKWSWYPPRNGNKLTIQTKDLTEYDFFVILGEDKQKAVLRVYRYNPKGYKTTPVLYKEFNTIGTAMLYAHKQAESMLNNGGKVL